MHLRIRRRRFGQLAIASAATAAITNLAGKAVAQSGQIIYGLSISKNNTIPQGLTNIANTTPAESLTKVDLTASQVVSSVEVAATTVSNVTTSVETAVTASATQPSERLTGLTTLSNGTLVSSSVASSRDGSVTRLSFTNPTSSKTESSLKLSGLPNNNSTVESLVALRNNDTLISVISLNAGTPPFDLATIDSTTGKVTSGTASGLPSLNSDRRYANLAQAPDGTLYGTSLGREGYTTLVQIDIGNKSINTVVPLRYNNKPLANDLLSLAVSPLGQLYALANPNYAATNSLFTVDIKTGVLTLIRQFDVAQIAFPRA